MVGRHFHPPAMTLYQILHLFGLFTFTSKGLLLKRYTKEATTIIITIIIIMMIIDLVKATKESGLRLATHSKHLSNKYQHLGWIQNYEKFGIGGRSARF